MVEIILCMIGFGITLKLLVEELKPVYVSWKITQKVKSYLPF